jgi:hypothetical protein
MRNTTQAPAGLPVLGIGSRILSLSAALMEHLRWQRVRVDVIDGRPHLTLSAGGVAVTATGAARRQGALCAPSTVNRIRDQLGVGTKWVMEQQGDSWIGRPLEAADLTERSTPGVPSGRLPHLAGELMRRMLRDGPVTVAPGYSAEMVLDKAGMAALIAWGDVLRGRTCERA